ncbi:hypothetical protein AF91_11135 [Lacticaseibacillus paracasei N1115]|uniref:Uncharacterized protein n=2 Tax=Lacticaseibacillus paracasei TaxID=1597 RepID=A0A806LGT7_LACPA|nr:hypothetical protein AF91_11135 [Lacticaseibacillus paracasei N1115]
MYSFQDGDGFWWPLQKLRSGSPFVTPDEMAAKVTATRNGGHVVTLVEEPKKVVLTKKQAKIVEKARVNDIPATYISARTNNGEESLLINAFVNGWTVEEPKRYVLPMPGTEYHTYQMHRNAQYYAVKGTGNWRPDAIALGTDDAVKHGYTVTQSDIDAAPAWVKAIKPLEVTDDGIR